MYDYHAVPIDIYDGDGTFDMEVDMGMNLFQRKDVRLFGVDTPEVRGEHKKAGIIVRDYVRRLMLDKKVILHTHYDKTGKYGRLLADVIIDGVSLNQHLLDIGYARVYEGGTKEAWDMRIIDKILFG